MSTGWYVISRPCCSCLVSAPCASGWPSARRAVLLNAWPRRDPCGQPRSTDSVLRRARLPHTAHRANACTHSPIEIYIFGERVSPPASVGTRIAGLTGTRCPPGGAWTVLRLRPPTLDLAHTRPRSSTRTHPLGPVLDTRVSGFARAVQGGLATRGAVGRPWTAPRAPGGEHLQGGPRVPGDPVEVVPCAGEESDGSRAFARRIGSVQRPCFMSDAGLSSTSSSAATAMEADREATRCLLSVCAARASFAVRMTRTWSRQRSGAAWPPAADRR